MQRRAHLFTTAQLGLVALLAVLCALWGGFLVPFRVAGTLLPVSLVIVATANVSLGIAGGRLVGKAGAALPGVIWLLLALTMGTKTAKGDLIIAQGWVGVGYLLAGVVGAAVAFGLTPPRRLRLARAAGQEPTPAPQPADRAG